MKFLLLIVTCLILHVQAQQEYGAEEVLDATEANNFEVGEVSLTNRAICSTACTCGIANLVVVNGSNPTLNRFPFALRLMVTRANGTKRFFCGAVLINNRYALSAASCFNNIIIRNVTAEIVRLTAPQVRGYIRQVTITRHPLYNNVSYDLALVKFNQAISFNNNNVFPICLPTANMTFAGRNGFTATWGHLAGGAVSTKPRVNIARIISNANCRLIANRTSISSFQLCAGRYVPGATSGCQSDYGGQLSTINKVVVNAVARNRHTLAGVASYGFGCVNGRAPGVYTRVASFLNFINRNTGDGCYCPN